MEQRSEEWFAARLGKVTASELANVLMKPEAAGYQNYRAQLVCERLTGRVSESFQSSAMQHGIDTEARARAVYLMETGLVVTEAPFVQHPKIEMAGASPDGFAGDGLVEIKCPQPAQHIRNLTGAKIARNYSLQMQWQMACTDREWCDFVSYNPDFPSHLQLHVQRVPKDAEMVEEITGAVVRFLADVDATITKLSKREAAA